MKDKDGKIIAVRLPRLDKAHWFKERDGLLGTYSELHSDILEFGFRVYLVCTRLLLVVCFGYFVERFCCNCEWQRFLVFHLRPFKQRYVDERKVHLLFRTVSPFQLR